MRYHIKTSHSVQNLSREYGGVFQQAAREFQLQGLIPPPESLEKAQANATAINQQIEKLCEAIRTRLTQFDEPDRVAQPSEQPPK
jgi:hypothetical protein